MRVEARPTGRAQGRPGQAWQANLNPGNATHWTVVW